MSCKASKAGLSGNIGKITSHWNFNLRFFPDVLRGFFFRQSRHFSHVIKSSILKNLNLRKKSDCKFRGTFREKPFQTPKIIFKSPKLIDQESLPYGHLLKDKRLKFTFSREPTFQVLVPGSSAPKKTYINKNRYFFIILDLDPPRNPKFGLFSMGKSLY